jgi:toxin ParE1/3/4
MDSIAEYIARDSIDQASLFVIRLIGATDCLQDLPNSGRIIPEIGNPGCREIIYGSYRIMYRFYEDAVWITGIVHGSRDWHPK